uniref:Protein farnesyltransferase/geranylgeranyltransferase type-1 subunit alpha n=1 Tax=Trichobilharzia regenti TaxID=157069 RepID=A0AA85KIJ5_TRIRE|nr:unnamed protein product [Trichobilharzia regenti]
MSTCGKHLFYRDRKEWNDITPVPQDDNGRHIVNIAYSEEFVDAHDYFRAVLLKNELSERTFSLTSEILLMNPANYTAWEYRRRIIKEISSDLNAELRFVGSLIEEYSKNYQLWHHRQWIVEELSKQTANGSCNSLTHLSSDELRFTDDVISDDPKNYHAWQHRRWIVTFFKISVEEELAFTERMLLTDVHNNSAWNHRFYIITLDEGLSSSVLTREIDFVQKRISFAPNNESSWNYFYGLLVPLVHNRKYIISSETSKLSDEKSSSNVIDLMPKLQLMLKFVEDLMAVDHTVVDCLAPLSFLVEVYTDYLELHFMKQVNGGNGTSGKQDSPHIDASTGDSVNITYDPKTIFDRAVSLCNRLANEVDRIRANYWQYRVRQLTCFAKKFNLPCDIIIS